jgi:ligand-binding sensor domain-containing protein
LFEDKEGNIWVGTKDGGLNLFNRKTKQFTRYLKDHDNFRGPSSAHITCIYQTNDGLMWIGTKDAGINEFDKLKQTFRSFKNKFNDVNSIPSNNINCIYEDNANRLWIGTEGGGISSFDKNTESFKKVINSHNETSETNDIIAILKSNQQSDDILIITKSGAIHQLHTKSLRSQQLFIESSQKIKNLSSEISNAIVDKYNNL